MYRFFKDNFNTELSNNSIKNNFIKMMILMIPFTPHLAHECLEFFNYKDFNNWPKIDRENILDEITLAVQVNGRTKDIINVKKDMDENTDTSENKETVES